MVADEELAAEAKAGSRDAFEELVRRYEKPLYNYIRKFIGNSSDAEDLFQETFLRVYKYLDRLRPNSPVRPWIFRIATNLCKDQLRYRKRHPTVSLNRMTDEKDGGTQLGDAIQTPEPGPRELSMEREMAERVQEAVARLSSKHRAVFLMARYDGMAYEEIATTLRIPVGTVKSRMNKAVNLLLDMLEESKG